MWSLWLQQAHEQYPIWESLKPHESRDKTWEEEVKRASLPPLLHFLPLLQFPLSVLFLEMNVHKANVDTERTSTPNQTKKKLFQSSFSSSQCHEFPPSQFSTSIRSSPPFRSVKIKAWPKAGEREMVFAVPLLPLRMHPWARTCTHQKIRQLTVTGNI